MKGITAVKQTGFVKLIDGKSFEKIRFFIGDGNDTVNVYLGNDLLCSGASGETAEAFIPETEREKSYTFLAVCLGEKSEFTATFKKTRHQRIHIIHYSHHDPGYTDLPSEVFNEHCAWIDRALNYLQESKDCDFDVRPRIVIEQAWSADRFLQTAPEERRKLFLENVRDGNIEITALYANFISEQLGDEEAYRALEKSFEICNNAGTVPVTAEHSDIPGISIGLCRVLCDAGIKMLMPKFPNYYSWGFNGLKNFWDDKKVFGDTGCDAFWWESPDGKRILMWCDTNGTGYSMDTEPLMERLIENDYPFETVCQCHIGAARDNSFYTDAFSLRAQEHNAEWLYPHIIISTNKMFYEDLAENEDLSVLPVLSGELPGQDYPLAAMSQAAVTSTAFNARRLLKQAELLYAFAKEDNALSDRQRFIDDAYTDLFLSDDHAYGFHFPAGSAAEASQWEKGVFAMRAKAWATDTLDKSMASIADRIESDSAMRLTVFNLTAYDGLSPVCAALRELDNCGSELRQGNHSALGRNRTYILNNRMRVSPSTEYLSGNFELVDLTTGEKIPFAIKEIQYDDPVEYASERSGLGQGTRRYGFFEEPVGLLREIRFADNIPAFGYKSYALVLKEEPCGAETDKCNSTVIENEFLRLEADETGIVSLIDKSNGSELTDASCEHRLGDIIVRERRESDTHTATVISVSASKNDVFSELTVISQCTASEKIKTVYTLYNGIPSLHTAVRFVKNPVPLQTVYMAFPFKGSGVRYRGVLSELTPVKDYFAGSQCDVVTANDYISVTDSPVVLTPHDSAVTTLCALRPGYISPAHSAVFSAEDHQPLTESDFCNGRIYSVLTANNFGTNFAVSQTADLLFRYTISLDLNTDRCSEKALCPPRAILTDRSRGKLPVTASLLNVSGAKLISLRSSDKCTYKLRLWNTSAVKATARISLPGVNIVKAYLSDACDYNIREITPKEALSPEIQANAVVLLTLVTEEKIF